MGDTSTQAGTAAVVDVDLTDQELYRGGFPHELFADLRRRGAVLAHPPAVPRLGGPEMGFWAVVRHAEVQRANRDWATFSAVDGPRIVPSVAERRGHTLTSSDPAVHTRLRKLISAGFTPRMIGVLDEQVRRRTEQILDAAEAAGECEFVQEVAYALPMHIIADIVGIPDADRPWVFGRTDVVMRANDPASGLDADDLRAAEGDLFAYAQRLGEDKRRTPTDDVWSLLATVEVDDDEGGRTRLEGVELDMFFLILSLAGSETTRNAISHGLLTLLEHPDQLSAVRAAARAGGGPLLDTATEEIVRWASPVTCFSRTATRDVELGGADIRAGDRITMWYPSANRDEDVFADPFRFDVTRSPNPHVSFGGGGVHYCLGAHLARREVRVMFEQLLARFDDIEVVGPVTRTASGPDQTVAVSVDRCSVRLTPAAA